MNLNVVRDTSVPFPLIFVRSRRKSELREFVARCALPWVLRSRGTPGAIVFDIDDTVVNWQEGTAHGFEYMKKLHNALAQHFPIHWVTARPDNADDRRHTLQTLELRGFHKVKSERLHMLPPHLYGKHHSHIEDFKFERYAKIAKAHGAVLARFGDKLWDVAHMQSLRGGDLAHVKDADCCMFIDPRMSNCLSCKLPEAKSRGQSA